MNILVADALSAAGIQHLQAQAGWNVIVSNPKEFEQHLGQAEALLVRSAAKVTKEVLAQAPNLRVVGRAGVGVDNVDLDAATSAGVLVMNTPGGNAVSVAEHTLALMLAMARSIPQASVSTKSGKWEKKKFLGTELRGKTLGIVGLGSIGREVARRAKPFEMRLIAADPYVNSQTAADLGIQLVDLETLYAESDYVTLHVALTSETMGMLNDDTFARMKQGVRVVNCARGELIDGNALYRALQSGKVGGAALDVFQTEPPAAGEPLLAIESVIATPHIGGSTEEAQEIVGIRIAEQVVEYLTSGVALNAVNMPPMTAEQYRAVGPYVELAEKLGMFAAFVASGNPSSIRIVYSGGIVDMNTSILRNAGVAGVLARSVAHRPNVVNSMQIAADRGISVGEQREQRSHMDTVRIELTTDGGTTTVEGAVVLGKARLLQVNGIYCEAHLGGHISYLSNEDTPGVIGFVGGVLGRHGVNIASFSLGRKQSGGDAIAVVETDQPVPEAAYQELLQNKAIKLARGVEFSRRASAAS